MRYLFMRQFTGHTCGPTTLRICANAFLQKTLSGTTAKHLCKTTVDGTTWSNLKRAYKNIGLRIFSIKTHTQKEWSAWLDSGYFIVTADEDTYSNSHVIVVHKNHNSKKYGVLDPMIGLPTARTKSYVIKSAKREAFAVCAA
jgi:ABC-type bacteriocin/lantibiotic exporter with double-glycine peptidase domain